MLRFFAGCAIVSFLFAPVTASAADDVSVRVRVWKEDGEPVRNAYVALIPIWRPWSEPLVETVAENGAAAFHVPKGVYHFVAGASGFQLSVQGPFRFLTGEGNVSAELKPLQEASGVVRGPDGKPLAGVRVAQGRAEITPPLGSLSQLAYRQLSGGWSAVTDEAGRWKLALPDGTTPLLFTAARLAPQWRLREKGDDKPLLVSMPTGAALQLRCDRIDPDLVVTLEREGTDVTGSVPHPWQRDVWARWVTKTMLEWPSLPAGTYSIYAKYPKPAFLMSRAIRIGSVTLTDGHAVNVEVKLPQRPRPTTATTPLFLADVPPAELVEGLQAFGVSAAGGAQPVRVSVQGVIGGSVLHLDTAGVHAPFYALLPDRFIAADLQSGSVPLAATMYQRSDVYAVIRSAEKDVDVPRTGMAVWNDCGKRSRIAVPIDIDKGNAHFTAAAGCRDGALSFAPFEPLLVSRPLRPGYQELGDYLLHAAAAADVHVVRDPDGGAVPDAAVRVMATDARAPNGDWIVAAEAKSGPDGWAHFDAVPVRRELQFLAQTAAGESSAAAEGRGEPRGRIVVDPLAIAKAASVIVVPKISETVRAISPAARVMNISIETADDRRADADKREHLMADGETEARFEPLKPGAWVVRALTRVAGSDALLKVAEIDLKSGETCRIEADLDPLLFSGRVTVGGKGAAAHVYVRNASSGDRQHFESQRDGSFRAVLAARGVYVVDVARVDAQGSEMRAGQVAFDDPARPVEIAIPATAAVVAHVRSGEKPVPGVIVMASAMSSADEGVELRGYGHRTDAEGNWKFDNLVPGRWLFSVRDPETGRAAQKGVSLHESDTADVDLDLGKPPGIQGRIRDRAGTPVPDALVDCLVVGAAGVPQRVSARSDFDGEFTVGTFTELTVPANCSVSTIGGIVDGFRAAAGNWVDLQLPAVTGTLQIADWAKRYSGDTFWLTAPDGRTISLAAVSQTAPRWGSSLRIDALAAGRWRVIRVGSIPQWNALAAGEFGSLTAVADVTLGAGTSETIQLYPAPAQGGTK